MSTDNALYWEEQAKRMGIEAEYYRKQLVDAHALLGRIVHQASERWDSLRITEFYPTENLHGNRSMTNPSGKQED